MSGARVSVGLIAVVMVTSVLALPLLGGGLGGFTEEGSDGAETQSVPNELETADSGLATEASHQPDAAATGSELELVSMDGAEPTSASLAQEREDALEAGVEEGIELAQAQGVEVSQEQRTAALEGASEFVAQYQEADVEQVQEATKGAVHGSLMGTGATDDEPAVGMEDDAAVETDDEDGTERLRGAVGGAVGGALSQHQTVEASQMQSAAWGATHGALAQEQRVTVEQIQVASFGAAAGAASEAGETDVERKPKIQEAAQGAAYGALEQYQKITVEQRQQVTLEHVQHAAAGASAGALEGSSVVAHEQEQLVEVEQHQRVDVKQVQKAAAGAAKGALVQKQQVTIEQTQAAARGAGKGSLIQVQSVRIEQVQRISIAAIQQASFGSAKGAIQQSQEATVEQIQYAAIGGAQGTLVQHQEVSITQIQYAATGASKGAVESAVQRQIVEVEQIQAAAWGAGEGAVLQTQVVDVTQVQQLARGASSGVLVQHQEATVTQLQAAARSACAETARAIQYQRISVTQLQILTQETAADATAYAVDEGTDDETRLVQFVEVDVVQKLEAIEELEGTATISFADQESDGESVVVDDVSLSEGGFVAVYDGADVSVDPDGIRGVSDSLEPGEHEDVEIPLDEPLGESGPLVAVVHHDTSGDETFRYAETDGTEDEPYVADGGGPVLDGAFVTLEEEEPDDPVDDPDEPADEPEVSLSVSNQTGDGETLTVDEANASVAYALAVTDEDGDERGETDPFEAGEPVENETVDLEPPLEDDAVLEVAVVSTDDDGTLANETIEYTLEEPVEELSVEYVDCTELEVTGTLEDGDSLVPRTLWYDSVGPGDTVFPGVTAGEEIDAPFTGTVVMTVGEEYDVERVDDETVVLEVPDEGAFGSFVVPWFDPADDAEEQLASPPPELDCGDEIQPDEPTIDVEDVEWTGSFDVTFSYDNPNDAALTGGEFVEGTTDDEPVDLEPGADEFTVAWTPEDDDERLVWEVPMENFGYDEPISAETESAGEYDAPGTADVEFVDCSRAEVTGSYEDGETVIVATGFYESGGFGNTMGEYALSVGDDVDAPFEGTIVFEIGDEHAITETDEGAIVEVPAGEFGAAITGISSPEATPGSIDYPNPDASACLEEIRPALPAIDVQETTPTDEGIDVTFEYDNPNDASLAVLSSFVEGSTDDEPVDVLSADGGAFTVTWTPATDDERLVWEIDMSNYDYEPTDWPVAETATAGEIDPQDPEPAEEEPTSPDETDDEQPESAADEPSEPGADDLIGDDAENGDGLEGDDDPIENGGDPVDGDAENGDDPAGDADTGDDPAGDADTGDDPAGDADTGDDPAGDADTGDDPAGDADTGDDSAGGDGDALENELEGQAESQNAGDEPESDDGLEGGNDQTQPAASNDESAAEPAAGSE
ncbi:DUF7282 domain-containing protein [Natrarchaeobius oligotrophus]|uniref:DUF7282 domain-containing protein n=1 Tax=Natrarchaeobius chitinivorans TaxID=1679083 RepID=A0A3N6PQ48_NATCH|nr:hypothetical protein [Natrarchaeobius chitinivorans]RQH01356.1 hypothetical protein EA472_07890 [Natrarchaeobius chitinivorans]